MHKSKIPAWIVYLPLERINSNTLAANKHGCLGSARLSGPGAGRNLRTDAGKVFCIQGRMWFMSPPRDRDGIRGARERAASLCLLSCVLALLCAVPVLGQSCGEDSGAKPISSLAAPASPVNHLSNPQARFYVRTEEVIVPVTVTDKQGALVLAAC